MNTAFHNIILANGYRNWKNEDDRASTNQMVLKHYQARVDHVYPKAPLCTTNDKLYVNIEYHMIEVPDPEGEGMFPKRLHESVEISVRHGAEDDVWFDLKAYSMKPEDLLEVGALNKIVARLIKAWEAVYSPE